ncbi:flightin isoform X2 [Halyomorpha halys]|uniref:flightin isoform X2 n=1 Tax=Halyomorpha halys TaxID=286706 RepID=UPI0006D506A4|nr:flightin isoform X2 [Halyomorpha halys]
MFDDDNSDWLSEAAAEPEPEQKPVEVAPPPAAAAAAAKKPVRPIAPETEVTHPKKQLNKHWARPRFLQYDYLYHYMHNYYDDYIEYLDNRMKGYEVERPRPQTWAERALRTYTRNTYPHSVTYKLPRPQHPDAALLNAPHWANTWHSEHSKDFYNRKYKAILF